MSVEKQDAYLRLLRNERDRLGLADQATSQFIAFRNAECDVVNQYCCRVYNNHSIYKEDKRDGRRRFDFLVNDKIMCTKNHDATLLMTKEEQRRLDGENEEDGDLFQEDQAARKITDPDMDDVTYRLMNGSVYTMEKVSIPRFYVHF